MNLTKQLSRLALVSMALGMSLVSCTNDLSEPGNNSNLVNGKLSPIVAPDAVVWSGNQVLGNSFTGSYNATTRAEAGGCNTDWNSIVSSWQKPKYLDTSDLTQEDIAKIRELLSPEGQVTNNTTIPYKNYWIQHVFKGTATYNAFDKDGSEMQTNKLASDAMDKLSALDPNDNYIDIGNFNSGKNESSNNVGTVNGVEYNFTVVGTSLMYNMGIDNITPTNQFRFHSSFGDRWFNNYYIIKYKDCYYIGFDYEGHKDTNNANEERDYNRDWKYDDWIVRIMPAYAIGEDPGVETPECSCGDGEECKCTPGECECPACKGEKDPCPNGEGEEGCGHPGSIHNPDGTCPDCIKDKQNSECYPNNPEEYCDKCGHTHHGTNNELGSCNVCNNAGQGDCYQSSGNNGGTGNNGNNGNKPNNGGNGNNGVNNKYTNNEVEINLSLNDIHTLLDAKAKYGIADLVSKLSIHVRYPHDVEVIIPVPESIYCDQDDLYILNDHYTDGAYGSDPNYGDHQFNGEEHILSYVVGDQTIDLIITYVAAKDDNLTQMNDGGYIRVRTRGINEAVIDYCRENFGDGINFEVYNYYNRGNMYTTGKYAEISFKDLQFNYLSHSMVTFDWNEPGTKVLPDFYINAFNNTAEGNPYYGDCYVWIWGDRHAKLNIPNDLTIQSDKFTLPYQGTHFNGSPFNWIYTAKHVTGSIDSSDMLNDGNWPFSHNGTKNHYFRNGNLGNYWYYNFNESGNGLATGNPFTKLAD